MNGRVNFICKGRLPSMSEEAELQLKVLQIYSPFNVKQIDIETDDQLNLKYSGYPFPSLNIKVRIIQEGKIDLEN